MNIQQFDIWWVDLDPTVGMETQKTKPCLIVSSNALNQGRMLFVAPFLKGCGKRFYAVNVMPSAINNLDTERRVDLRQMRSVDKARLSSKRGVLETQYHASVHQALAVLFN